MFYYGLTPYGQIRTLKVVKYNKDSGSENKKTFFNRMRPKTAQTISQSKQNNFNLRTQKILGFQERGDIW